MFIIPSNSLITSLVLSFFSSILLSSASAAEPGSVLLKLLDSPAVAINVSIGLLQQRLANITYTDLRLPEIDAGE